MNQFKDLFLGKEKRAYTRATTSQKCMRVSGKHNDLDNVGPSLRHHTFFEMLGNFSFGDYFKTRGDPVRLGAADDGVEAAGRPALPDHLQGRSRHPARRRGVRRSGRSSSPRIASPSSGLAENFWQMGDTGPCGRCSEIHYFRGNQIPVRRGAAGRPCRGIDCSCDRYVEVWNNVFMEFDRQADGTLKPLPAPSIDTGMGLERITAVIQGKLSNYDTDLFTPILDAIGAPAGTAYGATHRRPGRRLDARHRRPPARDDVPHRRRRRARRTSGAATCCARSCAARCATARSSASPSRSCTRSSTCVVARDGRRLSRAPHRPRQHRPRRAQRGGAVRRGADGGPAAARGGARSRRGRATRDARATRRSASTTRSACRSTSWRTSPASAASPSTATAYERAMEGQRERARAASAFKTARRGLTFSVRRSSSSGSERPATSSTATTTHDRDGRAVVALFDDERRQVDELDERPDRLRRARRTPFYLESGGQVSDTGRIVDADGAEAVVAARWCGSRRAAAAAPRARDERGRSGARQIVTGGVDATSCATRRGATTPPLTCCTRRCARCWART